MKLVLCLLVLLVLVAPAYADYTNSPEAKFASGDGNIAYLTVGALVPFVEDGRNANPHGIRTLDALGTSVLLEQALKLIVREPRPDTGSRNSFPSGHTTAAFAIAAMESNYHPDQAPIWYTGASLIGVSRIVLDRHWVHDVVAGAALGYLTARWELQNSHGLMLSPFIAPGSRAVGMEGCINF